MKKQKQFERFCNETLRGIQKELLLDSFILHDIKHKEKDDSHAECIFYFPYKDIQVQYSKSLYDEWESGDINSTKATLIHEMCHVITDPLYSVGVDRFTTKATLEDARENVTDHIANILYKKKIV